MHPPLNWTLAGKCAAVIGYMIFFVYMTIKAVQEEIEREADGETTELERWV